MFDKRTRTKRKIAILLAFAMMIVSVVPGLGVLETKAAGPQEGQTVLYSSDFPTTAPWWSNNKPNGSPEFIAVSGGDAVNETPYMTISAGDYGFAKGATIDQKTVIEDGGTYGYSFRAKSVSDGDVNFRAIAVWDSSWTVQEYLVQDTHDLTNEWAEYSGEMLITLDESKDDATEGLHQFQLILEPIVANSIICIDDFHLWEIESGNAGGDEREPDGPSAPFVTVDFENGQDSSYWNNGKGVKGSAADAEDGNKYMSITLAAADNERDGVVTDGGVLSSAYPDGTVFGYSFKAKLLQDSANAEIHFNAIAIWDSDYWPQQVMSYTQDAVNFTNEWQEVTGTFTVALNTSLDEGDPGISSMQMGFFPTANSSFGVDIDAINKH